MPILTISILTFRVVVPPLMATVVLQFVHDLASLLPIEGIVDCSSLLPSVLIREMIIGLLFVFVFLTNIFSRAVAIHLNKVLGLPISHFANRFSYCCLR